MDGHSIPSATLILTWVPGWKYLLQGHVFGFRLNTLLPWRWKLLENYATHCGGRPWLAQDRPFRVPNSAKSSFRRSIRFPGSIRMKPYGSVELQPGQPMRRERNTPRAKESG